MGNTHIENANKKVMQQVALVALVALPTFLDDDRVCCNNCQHQGEQQADEFVDIDKAKQFKTMGKKLGMPGDKFEQKGRWLRIYWTEAHCHATGLSPLPGQLKHRCHMFQAKPAAVESDSWWLT